MPTGAERTETLQYLQDTAPQNPDVRHELEAGLATRVYGPYLGRMLDYGAGRIMDGTLSHNSVISALVIAAKLYQAADQDYATQENTLTDEELATHQTNVLNGDIVPVSEEQAVSYGNSVAQVERADNVFYDQPDEVQAALAEINYGAFFGPQTMASAARTLDRRGVNKLVSTPKEDMEAMPHLTVSNWAIGQTLAGIYRNVSRLIRSPRIRVIDIGSGQGATLAAITNSLSSEEVDNKPVLSITGVEVTKGFYDDLSNFTETDQGASSLGLRPVRYRPEDGTSISEPGTITTINADAVQALKNLDTLGDPNQLTVITANYSLHRLGRRKKMEILDFISQTPNVIFLIGDLAQNTSEVNRRYFNLGVNGPLNAGNLYLRELFESFGFDVARLDTERPDSLDPRLAKRLASDDKLKDGHLWIAHRGALTAGALNLMAA
ncbi:MAG: hypothetical protein Q7S22_02795 [Candidatus Micrarchaeota archaeon]|nr:hypothetical protein [Candidatus Micrarchaeota archaeon]